MNTSALNEERGIASDLVVRVSNGDSCAELEMIKRYSRGLRFLLRRKTRDPALSEDFLQETWLIALKKIRAKPLKDPERLSGYLCGIANNLAQSEYRRVNRQQTSVNTDIVDLIPDESSNPLRSTSRAEVCRHVHDLINNLSKERDREILKRFYVREEDKESICSFLNVDGAHFNRVLFRARQRLRSLLEVNWRRDRFQVVD